VKDERLRMALSFHPLFIGGDPFHVTSMYILVSHLEKEFGVHYAMGGVRRLRPRHGGSSVPIRAARCGWARRSTRS
jgi:phytoene desaturase